MTDPTQLNAAAYRQLLADIHVAKRRGLQNLHNSSFQLCAFCWAYDRGRRVCADCWDKLTEEQKREITGE